MISVANIISSIAISEEEFLTTLNEVGVLMGIDELETTQRIFDGVSSVWIRLITVDEAGYEESDLKNFERELSAPPRTFIMLEYDEGATAVSNVLQITSRISQKWPILFDNCFDRVYHGKDIADLVAIGRF